MLLRELVPNAEIIAVLQEPNSPGFEAETRVGNNDHSHPISRC